MGQRHFSARSPAPVGANVAISVSNRKRANPGKNRTVYRTTYRGYRFLLSPISPSRWLAWVTFCTSLGYIIGH